MHGRSIRFSYVSVSSAVKQTGETLKQASSVGFLACARVHQYNRRALADDNLPGTVIRCKCHALSAAPSLAYLAQRR